jgi:hypothetical protein
MTGRAAADHVDVDAFWSGYLAGTGDRFAARATIRALSPSQQMRKLRAMRTYRTQFAGLDGPQRRLSHPALVAFEAIWEPASEDGRSAGTRFTAR